MLLSACSCSQAGGFGSEAFAAPDVPDGLAQGTVQAIHQDAKGNLWFGTFEGLSRFDGYRFSNYLPVLRRCLRMRGSYARS